MKMIPGTGDVSDYGNFISNCTLGQLPYKVPVTGLSDVQLFIDIGLVKPTTVQYELIHTCGVLAGTIETLVATNYVIGQDKNNRWYGVFKNLTGNTGDLNCFVIAITLDSNIYFSEEYCVDTCNDPTMIEGCYGNLNSDISNDCNGIYFGVHVGNDSPLGDITVTYKHKVFLRKVEVTLSAIRNSFKQGLTRTFRTEKEKIFQLWSELVPEWYLTQVDAVLYRGEVTINGIRYLLSETAFEKVDECLKQWRPAATFKDICYQSFSCDADPCAAPPEECCEPVVISATVDTVADESQSSGFPPIPDITNEIVIIHSVIGGTTIVTGTAQPVTGLTNGSSVVTCAAFAGMRVFVTRGQLPLPGVDPGGGQSYFTKNVADNFITFSDALVNTDIIYIETIP